jgi:hypothetical protein
MVRRFLNDYWLVPVLVIYLQLMAALMGSDSGQDGLMDQNKTFFSGVPLAARIVTHDFPYAIIGHSKEMWHRFAAGSGLSSEEVASNIALQKTDIYNALWASRKNRKTEIGGVLSIRTGGAIALQPVPSSNGVFLGKINGMEPLDAINTLIAPENAEMLSALAGNPSVLRRVARIITSDTFDDTVKQSTLDSVLYALEVASEARYVVLPVDFKEHLGHMETWHYAGVYHFHNELNSPPSGMDMESSFGVRQFVFCLAKDGFDLYDIEAGHTRMTHFEVLPEAWQTQPEWAPNHGQPLPL